MAYDLKSIQTGKKNLPPRIIMLGTHKIGKTTFGAQAPNPVILPFKGEQGTDDIRDMDGKPIDSNVFPSIGTYEETKEALGTLINDDHNYKTAVLDSGSTLEPIIWDKTVEEDSKAKSIEQVGGGFAKGYIEALRYHREIMEMLDVLHNERNMAIVVVGHVAVKSFNDPTGDPYDQFVWDIHHKAANAWMRWADCILFARKQTFTKTEDDGLKKVRRATSSGAHKLYTQERPAHPGGGRGAYGRLPYELDFSWGSFIQAVKEVG
jgi:hypothetical protein